MYAIPRFPNVLPDFDVLSPVAVIYTSSLNVPPRDFREGFPGVPIRMEWFAIDYTGRFWIQEPGVYQFALTSDDGAKLYIDGELVVNNDGIHPPQLKQGSFQLSRGIHRIRVSYFQGRRTQAALILQVAGPGQALRIFSTDEFKPPPNPEAWGYSDAGGPVAAGELRVSSAAAAPGGQVSVELSLRSLSKNKLVALSWEMLVPVQVLDLELTGNEPGTERALGDSGKLLKCSRQKSYLYFCTLAGGQEPLAGDAVASMHFKVRSEAQRTATTVRLQNVQATSVDGRQVTLNGGQGTVTIH